MYWIKRKTFFIIKFLFKIFSPKMFVSSHFKTTLGYNLNLNNPKTHNEKVTCRKLNYTDEMTLLSDKVAVRKYVSEKIGSQYLVPLYAKMGTLTKDVFDELPNSFVIKANHGSKFNLIVRDKNKFEYNEVKKITEEWLKTKYYLNGMQLHYENIKPQLLVEKLLLENNNIPKDYKLHCFNNNGTKKIFIDVYIDRLTHLKSALFDEEWNNLDYPFVADTIKNTKSITKPVNLKEMCDLARILSKPFEYIRLDFYLVNNKIYFGEFTFTPNGGTEIFHKNTTDLAWGNLWK